MKVRGQIGQIVRETLLGVAFGAQTICPRVLKPRNRTGCSSCCKVRPPKIVFCFELFFGLLRETPAQMFRTIWEIRGNFRYRLEVFSSNFPKRNEHSVRHARIQVPSCAVVALLPKATHTKTTGQGDLQTWGRNPHVRIV